jgi:hypothetical protein
MFAVLCGLFAGVAAIVPGAVGWCFAILAVLALAAATDVYTTGPRS